MSLADIYRQRSVDQRAAAAAEPLPLRRQQHERAAQRWETMAQEAANDARRAQINEAEKRARQAPPYVQPDQPG
ncbi:hypothetical protein [Sphingobium sp. CFD-2]|uniref:hypothetical protein n=1 Tax=Sphingobium sp. CFD-2 TaxID=2878542 RepID=UPI00214B166A|nr:hypothetical protein [Sphingobium sp. CFD-2]